MDESSRFSGTATSSDHDDVDEPRGDPEARRRLLALMAEAERGDRARPERSSATGDADSSTGAATLPQRLAQRWLPESWRRSRVDPGRAGVLAVVLTGVVAAVVVVVTVWSGRPSAAPAPPLPVLTSVPSSASTTAKPRKLVISVVGKVHRPGLVTVDAGARVADALRAAGGPLPGTEVIALNLARKLTDGEQLYVAVPVPANARGSGRSPTGRSTGAGTSKIDLNTASQEQLEELPGVGPVTAERILRWRREHDGFTEVGQLNEISGIGEVRFSRLKELVRV